MASVPEETTEKFQPQASYQISPVRSEIDLKDTIALFYQYVEWLNLDLNFQNFDAEMAGMPGKYAPPSGELLLARSSQGHPIGCVAVRHLDQDICEMKRLFVTDAAKGLGVGKALVSAVIGAGKCLGYHEMRLDTLPRMGAAISLYRSFDFVETSAYYVTPLPGTLFLKLDLTKIQGS